MYMHVYRIYMIYYVCIYIYGVYSIYLSIYLSLYIYVYIYMIYTSKSRASRLAEVSNFKKRAAIGSQKQVLPIGDATKPHTASQLCSLSSTSFCLIPFQL